ncbi:MAG: hypothetical protein ABII13_05215 [Patescibacteria group bacterium]|nr:hypothetical protein [Patescibacteria group bacterium]
MDCLANTPSHANKEVKRFTKADYSSLNLLFSGGDISSCTKEELERFAVMLSRPRAFEHFGASSFPQICETVRTLILVRMSEEQNVQAKKESRLALIIACVALLAGIIQAGVSLYQVLSSQPTLVRADTPLSVRATESIPVYSVPSAQGPQTPLRVVPVQKK